MSITAVAEKSILCLSFDVKKINKWLGSGFNVDSIGVYVMIKMLMRNVKNCMVCSWGRGRGRGGYRVMCCQGDIGWEIIFIL